jgi:hypothetical protein
VAVEPVVDAADTDLAEDGPLEAGRELNGHCASPAHSTTTPVDEVFYGSSWRSARHASTIVCVAGDRSSGRSLGEALPGPATCVTGRRKRRRS